MEYLRKKYGYTFWIILDNIDQHFYCLHETAFVNSLAVANELACNLIVSLRYISLNTNNAREVYDSYRPRKIKLSLPDIKALLLKRINYFQSISSEIENYKLKHTGYTLNCHDLLDDIRSFTLKICESKTFLKSILLPLSNYNIRRLLDILLSCYQSYYLFYDRFNNERYLPTLQNLDKRFLYAHLLKNIDYYDPKAVDAHELFIINLFENENKTIDYNQILRIRLLQSIMIFGRDVKLTALIKFMLDIFSYDRFEILLALRVFMNAQLFSIKGMLTSNFDDSIVHDGLKIEHFDNDNIDICLSHAGRLHYDLLFKLEYVEIMKLSTYVDSNLYASIQSEENQETFQKRSRSTKKFISYMEQEEKKDIQNHVINIQKFEKNNFKIIPEIKKIIYRELDNISKSI